MSVCLGNREVRCVLFAGYAPVHFVCFLPVYRQLMQDQRIEVWLTGGFRRKSGQTIAYELKGLYDSFDVDSSQIISVEQARRKDFDVMVCACLSGDFIDLFRDSVGKTVEIFHGVSFKNLLVREKALRYDVLCLPGHYHASLYRKHGLIRADSSLCAITGFPKVDSLVSGTMDRERILRTLNVDPGKTTLLYAPTGGRQNSLEIMGEEVIKRVGTELAWNLLIKPHDHPKNRIDWFSRLAPFENERVRLVRDNDVVPYMYAADLLISDASSVSVEYTLLDRPIVFLNVPSLLAKSKRQSKALDLETYGTKIGRCVESPEEVVGAIRESLDYPKRKSDIRKAAAQEIFYEPGHATGRVTGMILYAAGVEEAPPPGVICLEPDVEA